MALDRVFEFLGAKRIGATHVLDGAWKRLGLQDAFERLLEERAFRTPIERLLFALHADSCDAVQSAVAATLNSRPRKTLGGGCDGARRSKPTTLNDSANSLATG